MTPLTVKGKTLLAVKSLPNFDCKDCFCGRLRGGNDQCVRINQKTKELFFESFTGNDQGGLLYCINATEHDLVFINDTPEDIARYVAARLENT